jgi:solute carrier family 25 folate transporter 32
MQKDAYSLSRISGIYKNEGFKGMYRGLSISIVCIPLFHSLYFPLYEGAKEFLSENYGMESNSFKLYALSAGWSGLICNVLTNPMWVVRTRMQAEIFRSESDHHFKRKYKGIFRSLL